LGWVIDEQKLFIGNGTVADGAPAIGNTEILTSGSSAFSSALKYVYKGYLGNATPIVTGDGVDILRTLQERLDDYVSVKAFGAVGNDSTNDTAAIQRALEELYSDIVDQDDTRSSRILFFPAGTYNISASLKIPPYARLCGEGRRISDIRQSGGNAPVAVTEDNGGNTLLEHRYCISHKTHTDHYRRNSILEWRSLCRFQYRLCNQYKICKLWIQRHICSQRSRQFQTAKLSL
jgi:hypothetical protein